MNGKNVFHCFLFPHRFGIIAVCAIHLIRCCSNALMAAQHRTAQKKEKLFITTYTIECKQAGRQAGKREKRGGRK